MSAPIDQFDKTSPDAQKSFLQSVVKSFRKKNPDTDVSILDGKDPQAVVDELLQHYVKEGKPLVELLDSLPKE